MSEKNAEIILLNIRPDNKLLVKRWTPLKELVQQMAFSGALLGGVGGRGQYVTVGGCGKIRRTSSISVEDIDEEDGGKCDKIGDDDVEMT